MAEVTGMRNNALPYPIYAEQFTVTFPMLDADGDLVTGATTPDAEVSKNGDTFADCTNESTEIATSSGVYYLNLTAAEMTADIVTVIAKSATAGMKTTVITLYPRKLVKVRTGTCNDDGSGTADVVLDANASAVDDYYNGMVVAVVIDGAASAECRVITDYVGSTKTATVATGFNTAVDNTDTYTIYLPEGAQHADTVYGDKIYSDTTTIQSDTTSLASDLAEGDFSDILSRITAIGQSEGDISDILSRLTVTNSQLLIVKSDTSDIRSFLTVIDAKVSDIQSDTNVMVPIVSDIQSDTNVLITKMRGVVLATGTIGATGNTTTVVHVPDTVLDSLSDDEINNYNIVLYDNSNDEYHVRTIVDWTNTGDLATVSPAFPFTPEASVDLYWIMPPWSNQFDGDISDVLSLLTAVQAVTSDIQSDTNKLVSDATEVDTSDILSLLTLVRSDTAHIESDAAVIEAVTSDIQSDTNVMVPVISDIQSDTNLIITKLGEADTSDILSLVTKVYSDTTAINTDTAATLAKLGGWVVYGQQTIGGSGNDTTHVHLDDASDEDDELTGFLLVLYDVSAATFYKRTINDYDGTTKLALVDTLPITPQASTDLYWVLPLEKLSVTAEASALTSDQDSKLTRVANAIVEVDTSDIQSLLTIVNSRVLVIKSDTSDIVSNLVVADSSDVLSRLTVLTSEGDFSDILSRLTVTNSQLVVVKSDAAHIESQTTRIHSDTITLASDLAEGDFSDILSRLTVTNSQLLIVKSDTSDIRSALVIVSSDTAHIESQTTRIHSDTITLASDLAEGDFSDILSRLTVTNSQLLIVKSDTSDIRSFLTVIDAKVSDIQSDTNVMVPIVSDIQSDTNKLVSDASEVDASDILSLLTLVRSDTTHIESDAAAVESKTAGLTYTVAGQVDANIESVNGTAVTGTGQSGDEWGPA